jgi:hypothetical protein
MRLTVVRSPTARAGSNDLTFRLRGGEPSSRDHSPRGYTNVGLFVPKPSRDADHQRRSMSDLETTVRQRLLVSTVGDGDCYSVGLHLLCTTSSFLASSIA